MAEPGDISNHLVDHFETASNSKNCDPDFIIEKEQQEQNQLFFSHHNKTYNTPLTLRELDHAVKK